MAMELWNKYLVTVDHREFVDCVLLDDICGKALANKYRKLEPIVKELLEGTRWTVPDVFRRKIQLHDRQTSVVVAAGIMQHILLRGLKPEMPWNETRRSLVRLFFTDALIPDEGPGPFTTRYIGDAPGPAPALAAPAPAAPAPAAPAPDAPAPPVPSMVRAIIGRKHNRVQERVEEQIRIWKSPVGARKFWRQVFLFAKNSNVSLHGLVQFIRENTSKKTNYGKVLINAILTKRGAMRNFCDHLAIAMKTGNMETLVNVIRDHIAVKGLHCNIVPSIRNIKISTANLVHHFIALCQPERTYSGFRVDIVASVRLIAFLLLKKTDISGMEVRKLHTIYT